MMRQIVNDNCDFLTSEMVKEAFTAAKTYEDTFADLRNGNLTLPMFMHLQKGIEDKMTNAIKLGVKETDYSNALQEELFRDIQPTLRDANEVALGLNAIARKSLDAANSAFEGLQFMNSIAVKNRLYVKMKIQKE